MRRRETATLPVIMDIQSTFVQTNSPSPSTSSSGINWKEAVLSKREKGILKLNWKDRFIILLEGSLFYYQTQTDLTPRGVYHLARCHVEDVSEKKAKRKNVFTLVTPDHGEIYFGARDESERADWIDALRKHILLQPSPPPEKEFMRKTKSASVYISGKLIDSVMNLGNTGKYIREIVTDDTLVIIESVKAFLTQYYGSEKATKAEKQLLSIGAKVAVLYKEKQITKQYFECAIVPLRLFISKVIDGQEIPFAFSVVDLIDSLRTLQKLFEQILRPYLHEKTLTKLKEIFDLLCNESMLEDFFEKKKWKECELVGTTLRRLWDDGYF